MKSSNVGIVGAGIGGLSAGMRLSKQGYQVDIFEKLSCPGGRNNMLEDAGFKFDMGPSFILMPDFFEELFSSCGEKLSDHIKLACLDPSYKIFYSDGDCLTVHQDSAKTKQEIERFEPGASSGFDGFIRETSRIYDHLRPLLGKSFTYADVINPEYWPLLLQIRPFESYWQLAKRFFKSEKLCYAFTFEAMFMGVSPFEAPAFYSIISYADHVQKIFHPMGGMYQLPLVLERLCKKFGCRFHYDTEVNSIASQDNGIALEYSGSKKVFDNVVVNADYAYAQSKLLGRRIPRYRYSCSVYLLYLGLKKKVKGVAHHNLFFARDLRKNLSDIFKNDTVPMDPSFYVHVPTVTDQSLAPEGKDIFYILVPVPNLERSQDGFAPHEAALRKTVFENINRQIGIDLEDLIEVEHRFYPKDFIGRYNIKNGATFGLSHNLTQSAFFRPANFDHKIKRLFYVGASTQPGGGLPVVIAGSGITAGLLSRGV